MRTLTGIQTGPRQFELPPNIPVFDSAGRYDDAEVLAADVEMERVVLVVPSRATGCRSGLRNSSSSSR